MTVVPPGGGEVVGDAPDRRVEILGENADFHLTWTRFGPGRDGADLHVHHLHADHFYVLDGELTMRLGPEGHEVALPRGGFVRVPPLVVHGFRNGSDAEVRYLNLHAPGCGFADFLRGRPGDYDQYDPPDDGGGPADTIYLGPPDGTPLTEEHADPGSPIAPGRLYVLEGELDADGTLAPAGSWVDGAAAIRARRASRVLRVRTSVAP